MRDLGFLGFGEWRVGGDFVFGLTMVFGVMSLGLWFCL